MEFSNSLWNYLFKLGTATHCGLFPDSRVGNQNKSGTGTSVIFKLINLCLHVVLQFIQECYNFLAYWQMSYHWI